MCRRRLPHAMEERFPYLLEKYVRFIERDEKAA